MIAAADFLGIGTLLLGIAALGTLVLQAVTTLRHGQRIKDLEDGKLDAPKEEGQ